MTAAPADRPFFYASEGERFLPAPLATSPWSHGHQNGFMLAGLVAHLAEAEAPQDTMPVGRLTIEIMRPVPFGPVEARRTAIKAGRKIDFSAIEILSGGLVCLRAGVLRVRMAESPAAPDIFRYPPPEAVPDHPAFPPGAFGGAMASRLVKGSMRDPGPCAAWTALDIDVVRGTPASPFVRAVMLADVGNGFGSVFDRAAWDYPNVDITIYFTRQPAGRWLLADSSIATEGNGTALSTTHLADADGRFAQAHQLIFVMPRPGEA